MTVLTCIYWIMTSQSIVTTVSLLMFVFGLLFKLMRGT